MHKPDAYTLLRSGTDELTVIVGDARYVIANTCTHRKGGLYYGKVGPLNHTIRCPLHHSLFDLRTGKRLAGPSCSDLTIK